MSFRDDLLRTITRRRLSRVDTHEVINWAESAVNAVHRNLDMCRKDLDGPATGELRKAVSQLAGALDVLDARKHS